MVSSALNSRMDLSVIIPVFNKQNSILAVYNKLHYLIKEELGLKFFEIIFIDDASTDESMKTLESLRGKEGVCLIKHDRNMGQRRAVESGLRMATGNITAIYSCDMQNSFDTIVPLYKAIESGYDLAIGFRADRSDFGVKAFFSKIFYAALSRLHKKMPPGGYDFGLCDSRIKEALLQKDLNNIFWQIELLNLAQNIYCIPTSRLADKLDSSSWGYIARFKYALKSLPYLFTNRH